MAEVATGAANDEITFTRSVLKYFTSLSIRGVSIPIPVVSRRARARVISLSIFSRCAFFSEISRLRSAGVVMMSSERYSVLCTEKM